MRWTIVVELVIMAAGENKGDAFSVEENRLAVVITDGLRPRG